MKQWFVLSALALASAAQAHIQQYTGTFAPEAPGATGSGTLLLEWDKDDNTLFINATFAGLSGNTSTAHIHCCTEAPRTGTSGVALATGGILPNFPLGVKSGTYTQVIDLKLDSSYGGAFRTASGGTAAGARERLMANLESGNAYFNIHSSSFPGGEIRAFVTAVPEPGTWAMMGLGLAAVGALARRRT